LEIFQFKKFKIIQNAASVFKVNTEAVLLSAWVSLNPDIHILEIGSGTGVISIGLIQRLKENSNITAIDIDTHAYNITKRNIEANQIDNITAFNSSLQEFYSENIDQRFDLILSNPPYFDSKFKSEKPRNIFSKYTDNLDYTTLINLSSKLLKSDGTIALVLPFDDLDKIKTELNLNNLVISKQLNLSTIPRKKPLRVLLEIKKSDEVKETEYQNLLIKDNSGNFTQEYIDYTKDYYTIF
jgi:tRNA1Val (adenine37-N6)-methyltransferase